MTRIPGLLLLKLASSLGQQVDGKRRQNRDRHLPATAHGRHLQIRDSQVEIGYQAFSDGQEILAFRGQIDLPCRASE